MRCDVTTLLYSYSSLENEYIHHPTIRRQPRRPGVLKVQSSVFIQGWSDVETVTRCNLSSAFKSRMLPSYKAYVNDLPSVTQRFDTAV